MKKILTLILTICMIAGILPTGYAINAVPISHSEEEQKKAEIVEILNIMPLAEDSALPVSRGEFVSYITKILFGTTQIAENTEKKYFEDVEASHPHAGAIYSAVNIGLINGNDDGNFRPDEPILWNQAIKILVVALGYGAQAEKSGGYPLGYINVAGSKKLLRSFNISVEDVLSFEDCKLLLYRAITIPYVKLKAVSKTSSEFEISENGTWLLDYLNIKTVNGVVTETGRSSLLRKSRIEKDQIRIENEVFEDSDMLGQELLGYDVTAFVENEENGDVKLIMPEYNQNKCLVIDARDLLIDDSEYGMSEIIYRDYKGKKQKAALSSSADIIFNGVAYANCEDNDLKITSGTITLINSDGGSAYSIAVVESCKTYVVNNVTTEEKAVYDKYSQQMVTLLPDKEDVQYKIEDIDGNEISIDEISVNDVISVYESKDGSFVKIICSGATLSGKITAVQSEDSLLYIDDEPYEICFDYTKRIMDGIDIGKSYTFWLNDKKEIAEYEEKEPENVNTAYLIKAGFTTSGLSQKLELKLYTLTGEFLIKECADKIYLDGSVVKVNKESYDNGLFANVLAADTLIDYELNEEGKITSVDLPYIGVPNAGESEDSLRVIGSQAAVKFQYRTGPKMFVKSSIFMDSNTKCLQLPEDLDNEDGYAIKDSSGFYNAASYTVRAFGRNADNLYSRYVLVYDWIQQIATNRPFVVSEKRVKIDENGEELEQLNGYNAGKMTSYVSDVSGLLSGFNEGDVIMPLIGPNGNVVSAKSVFEAENEKIGEEYVKDIYSGSHSAVITKVYNKSGDIISVTNEEEVTEATVPSNTYKITNCDVYIYDSSQNQGNKLKSAGRNDILDFTHNNNPSKIMVYAVSFIPYIVIILK